MSSHIECSICRTLCSESCYERHRRRYACHNRECGLHYPEDVVADRDTFVLGPAETYRQTYPEQGRRSPRDWNSQRTSWPAAPEGRDSPARGNCGRSPYPRRETHRQAADTTPIASNYDHQMRNGNRDLKYDLFEGSTLCGTEEEDDQEEDSAARSITSSYLYMSIPDSRDHYRRSIRRSRSRRLGHRQATTYTLPSAMDVAVHLSRSPEGRSSSARFRRALRGFFCGLSPGTGRNREEEREARSTLQRRYTRPLEERRQTSARSTGQPAQARRPVPVQISNGDGQENDDDAYDDDGQDGYVEVEAPTAGLPPLTRQAGKAPERPAGTTTAPSSSTSGGGPRGESTWVNGTITLVRRGPGNYVVREVTTERVTRFE